MEVAKLSQGLTRQEAMLWRQQFQSMGWWNLPGMKRGWTDSAGAVKKRESSFNSLLNEHHLPTNSEDANDPWVFLCKHKSNDDWVIQQAWIDRDADHPAFRLGVRFDHGGVPQHTITGAQDLWILATRCRLAYLDLDEEWCESWPYADMSQATWKENGQVSIKLRDGRGVNFKVKTKGPGVAHFMGALAMFGDRPSVGYRAVDEANALVSERRGFMDVIGQFTRSIVMV